MSISLALIPFAIAAITAISTGSSKTIGEEREIKIKTGIMDKNMLLSSLDNYGYMYQVVEDDIITHIGNAKVTFCKNEQNGYDAVVVGSNLSAEKSEIDIQDIYDEYQKVVQEDVYKNLLCNAESKGMKLENEEVLEDNSILLTFNIEG